jgi:hypothetical protein
MSLWTSLMKDVPMPCIWVLQLTLYSRLTFVRLGFRTEPPMALLRLWHCHATQTQPDAACLMYHVSQLARRMAGPGSCRIPLHCQRHSRMRAPCALLHDAGCSRYRHPTVRSARFTSGAVRRTTVGGVPRFALPTACCAVHPTPLCREVLSNLGGR